MNTYMLNEILEQPSVIQDILSKFVSGDNILIDLPENISKLRIIASGSSYNAASIMTYFFKANTNLDVNCDYSSEFVLKPYFKYDKNTLYIFISQSGETADTINALRKVKIRGIPSLILTNKENSTLWREATYKMLVYAGEEKSVAATKSFSAQILCLYLIMLRYIQIHNCEMLQERLDELKTLSKIMSDFLETRELLIPVAKILSGFQNIEILGNRVLYALAGEGALKIKETSYININAHPFGEFLHGHLAILNNKSAIIALIDEENIQSNLKTLNKILADYNPTIVTVSETVDVENFDFNFHINKMPLIHKVFTLVLFMQLLACQIATELGRDVDKPKGLKKVVTE